MTAAFLALMFLWTNGASSSEPRTLQEMIDSAPDGGELRVPPGHYHGHFKITKPITLRAEQDVVLDGDGSGSVLKIAAPDVTIEGLVFQGSGTILGNADSAIYVENSPRFRLSRSRIRNSLFGLQILGSPETTIESSDIEGDLELNLGRRGDAIKVWYSPGTQLLENHVSDARDILIWYSNRSVVRGNTIEKMRYGLHYMYSHQNRAEDNVIQNNSVGIYEMYSNDLTIARNRLVANRGPSGYGFAAKESDRATVTGNHIIGNRVGLYIDNSPLSPPRMPNEATLFQDNLVARNDVGVDFTGSCVGSLFLKNDFTDNWQQVSTLGLSRDAQRVWENNYWSDYRGVDPARGGIGAIPHVADSLVDNITDRITGFKIFNFGPALLALDFAERIFPWLKPDPKVVDHSPSMRPHVEEEVPRNHLRRGVELSAIAAMLLVLSFGLRRGFAL